MKVVRLGSGDAELCRQAATLHIQGIHHGLLPLLGHQFLTKMYLCIAVAPEAGVWAMADGARLVGFVAGCASVPKTYRWLVMKHGPKLALAAGPALFRLDVLAKLYSILFYPVRRRTIPAGAVTTAAELLAIAVDANEYGKGYGKKLIEAFEASLCKWGVRAYRVLTNVAEKDSNAFYRAVGFAPTGTIRHHALTLQVYEKTIAR
jgi:GNAT superfamily N-acetyltransferase